MSDQMGVSRTVIREAIKSLAAKGLAESRAKRGTIVRPARSWTLTRRCWTGKGGHVHRGSTHQEIQSRDGVQQGKVPSEPL